MSKKNDQLKKIWQELKARYLEYSQDPSEANKKAWVKTWNESSPMVMDALLVDPALHGNVQSLMSEFLEEIKKDNPDIKKMNLIKDHIVERNNELISEMQKKLDRLDTMAEAAEKALGIVGSVVKLLCKCLRKFIEEQRKNAEIASRILDKFPPSLLTNNKLSASVTVEEKGNSVSMGFEDKSPEP
ncbi:hypothetical protein [Caedibacter taeniospiralis]|jgi:hypothetical protein|uniref:hypothetical protein n=1 Tax=Caedibacter taeniospiralis TaxID=28907 RepID=UPI0037BE8689